MEQCMTLLISSYIRELEMTVFRCGVLFRKTTYCYMISLTSSGASPVPAVGLATRKAGCSICGNFVTFERGAYAFVVLL